MEPEQEQKRLGTSMVRSHRWTSLPDDIIINIISRLNVLCDTVINISATSFSIEQHYDLYDKLTYNIYEYWTILDNLFILFAPPVINTFCLHIRAYHYREPRCWPIIDTWARRLRSRNVQHMKLTSLGGFRRQSDHRLYLPNVFQMHSLLTLDIWFWFYGEPVGWRLPNSIVLPNLKKLDLGEFNYAYLGRLLSCCPSLEDLSLSINDPQEIVVLITSSSLKRLHILKLDGKSIHDVIIDTPILEQLYYCSNSLLSMQMLDLLSNVKSLTINSGSEIRFINWPTTLPELIRLQLSTSFVICQAILEQEIMHCPNLEVLVLNYLFDNKEIIWNQGAAFMLVQQVKRIELYTNDNRFSKNLLNLVTLLIRSAKVLEKLVLFASVPCFPSSDKLVKSQFCQTLFECVESNSSQCQVELLGAYERD